MKRFDDRLQRLDDIERTLVQNPRGLTVGQLARLYQVNRTTIYRDLSKLEERGTGLIKDKRRWRLDHRRSLYSARFTQYELVALFLAARLLSRHSDENNPHVIKALEKLADALRSHSPMVAGRILQASASVQLRPPRPEFVEAFQVITQAWLQGRKARLVYFAYSHTANDDAAQQHQRTERLFSPYFIEPAGPGFSCYVIGMDDLRHDIRTLKLERIQQATLTDERFTLDEQFDPEQRLASAWGINWGTDELITVRILFAARIARRLKESFWHPSQQIEDLPDGSCLFTARIGSLLEFTPWVRQWGADVEVIQPPELRDTIIRDLQAQLRRYSRSLPANLNHT